MVADRGVDCVFRPRSAVPPDGYFLSRFDGHADPPPDYGRRFERGPDMVARRTVYCVYHHAQRQAAVVCDGCGWERAALVGELEGGFVYAPLEFLIDKQQGAKLHFYGTRAQHKVVPACPFFVLWENRVIQSRQSVMHKPDAVIVRIGSPH